MGYSSTVWAKIEFYLPVPNSSNKKWKKLQSEMMDQKK
jgi:hypothetical protein